MGNLFAFGIPGVLLVFLINLNRIVYGIITLIGSEIAFYASMFLISFLSAFIAVKLGIM